MIRINAFVIILMRGNFIADEVSPNYCIFQHNPIHTYQRCILLSCSSVCLHSTHRLLVFAMQTHLILQIWIGLGIGMGIIDIYDHGECNNKCC